MSNSDKKAVPLFDELVKKIEALSGIKFNQEELTNFDIRKERAREARLAHIEIEREYENSRKKAIEAIYRSHMVDPKITFDSLIVDDYNQDAINCAKLFCYAQKEDNKVPLLFIQGAEGTGKTMLCHAIANYWLENHSHDISLTSLDQIRKTRFFYTKDESELRDERDEQWEKYLNKKLIILDGFLQSREGMTVFDQKIFSELLRERHARSLPMVITTPVMFSSLTTAMGGYCYESLLEYEVLAKSLLGASRRKPLIVNGVAIS